MKMSKEASDSKNGLPLIWKKETIYVLNVCYVCNMKFKKFKASVSRNFETGVKAKML